MFIQEIKLSPYEVNNVNLMIHIGKENGVLVTQQNKNSVCAYAINKEANDRFYAEWNEKYTELFVYCERYKMLKLPHLKLARTNKVEEMIQKYRLNNKYKDDYKTVIKEYKNEIKVC